MTPEENAQTNIEKLEAMLERAEAERDAALTARQAAQFQRDAARADADRLYQALKNVAALRPGEYKAALAAHDAETAKR